jgi:Fur family peroxide stress response transcriptional regulator
MKETAPKRRKTAQKVFVRAFMLASYSHPTAEDILEAGKKAGVRLSLASVYRILEEMEEEGEAVLLVTPDGARHFDCARRNHAHFICRACGRIIDLTKGQAEAERLAEANNLSLESPQGVVIYGLCPACLEQERKEKDDKRKASAD